MKLRVVNRYQKSFHIGSNCPGISRTVPDF